MNNIATIAAATGVIACGLYAAISALKFLLSLRYASIAAARNVAPAETDWKDADEADLPKISVVQPILSGDPNLKEALRRNLQAATTGQFYWMIDDDDDEAAAISAALAAEFPNRTTVIRCPPSADDENPKTFKLRIAAEQLTGGLFAVLDDDTMIDDFALMTAADALNDRDLVTGLPCYEPASNLWGSLLTHFVNNNSITTYLPLLNFAEPISINGMFYMLRLETIRQHRPFDAILNKVCDDYELARFFRENNLRIEQLTTNQRIITHVANSVEYRRIMHRWFVFANRLFRDQSIGVKSWLLVMLSLPPLLLWLTPLSLAAGWPGVFLLVTLLLFRHLHLRHLHAKVFGFRPPFSWWRSLAAELLQPIQIIGALTSPRIVWRGKPMRLDQKGGLHAN